MNGLRYGISSLAVTVSRSTRVPRSGPTPETGFGRGRRIGPGKNGGPICQDPMLYGIERVDVQFISRQVNKSGTGKKPKG